MDADEAARFVGHLDLDGLDEGADLDAAALLEAGVPRELRRARPVASGGSQPVEELENAWPPPSAAPPEFETP